MYNLQDIVAANNLLVSVGGDDQLPLIATRAIEKSIELQTRIDRALDYAKAAPPNSLHAQQMARILDGSITHADEIEEIGSPQPVQKAVEKKKKTPAVDPYTYTKRPESALKGRSHEERRAFRQWAKEQNIGAPLAGPLPKHYVDLYDQAMEESRRMRAEQEENRSA